MKHDIERWFVEPGYRDLVKILQRLCRGRKEHAKCEKRIGPGRTAFETECLSGTQLFLDPILCAY